MFYTYLSGRGANGNQGDRGVQIHAIRGEASYPNFATAICGATPGKRSEGWSEYRADAPTCPKCAKKLEHLDNCTE
jgi:hypothetical protein